MQYRSGRTFLPQLSEAIERVQKRALNIIYPEAESYALFTHKILYCSTNISTIFHRSLTRASEIHTYNIRFASKLNFHRPKANNNYGTSTFAFVSSQLWETIPTNIKRLPYTSFCNQYKLYLLNMQSSEQPVY